VRQQEAPRRRYGVKEEVCVSVCDGGVFRALCGLTFIHGGLCSGILATPYCFKSKYSTAMVTPASKMRREREEQREQPGRDRVALLPSEFGTLSPIVHHPGYSSRSPSLSLIPLVSPPHSLSFLPHCTACAQVYCFGTASLSTTAMFAGQSDESSQCRFSKSSARMGCVSHT